MHNSKKMIMFSPLNYHDDDDDDDGNDLACSAGVILEWNAQ